MFHTPATLQRCHFVPAFGAGTTSKKSFQRLISQKKCLEAWKRTGAQTRCLAAVNVQDEEDVLASINLDYEEEGEFCMPGQVVVHQDTDEASHISIKVKDYPGLLRVIAWVFNGLELVVKKASLDSDEEGFVLNSFWVVDRADKPLTKAAADLTAERLGDFIVYCTPSTKAMKATFFEDGPITVDNDSHEDYTVVTVLVSLEIEGALLKVTSALTNSGCSIQKGEIKILEDHPNGNANSLEPIAAGQRIFRFWVTSRDKKKLDYMRATSLLYTMGLVFGKAEGPLRPPSTFRP